MKAKLGRESADFCGGDFNIESETKKGLLYLERQLPKNVTHSFGSLLHKVGSRSKLISNWAGARSSLVLFWKKKFRLQSELGSNVGHAKKSFETRISAEERGEIMAVLQTKKRLVLLKTLPFPKKKFFLELAKAGNLRSRLH